ncbi:hydrogenase maturation nickel metallochaperone HypA [Bacillus benzoevorans]|uniref:Hydrogenase maturation factor HypA n=2 Tax=Bacillus benzoevorans TaxID=1456 RepID=A0A7X0HS49_9BACI|nr:hydrogenase maturation nickel metallochaperone HypA [Bacillus benzoevorans]MBB6444591.1 hydrogenase nickel incorporation protein HypA/HybF [Bacillus benzoevorans]
MHEMALMGDILNLVQEDALPRNIKRLKMIELMVGELANAMPDALRMAFAIYKEQNQALFTEDAELRIVIEDAEAECIFCHTKYHPDMKITICPTCRMPSGKIITGETFQVLSYEGEEHE